MSARARALLTRDDWVAAGQVLLRDGGVPAVKLTALTGALGVTSGSFYHHFTDVPDYLGALADAYATADLDAAFAAVADAPPIERLRTLFAITADQDIPRLDRAMRIWAATNPRAEAAVARLDHRYLEFLTRIFGELGFDDADARTRALLAYAAGAALIFTPWPRGPEDAERAIALLTGDSAAGRSRR